MSELVHLRYLYVGEGLSRLALCGECPARWIACRLPAKADGLCEDCARMAHRWRRLPNSENGVLRFAIARAAVGGER